MAQKSADISAYIRGVNGNIVRQAWAVGYIIADIDKAHIPGLLNVDAVSVVESDFQPDTKSHLEYYVGNHGLDSRTDVEDYLNEGYDGGQSNIGRNGYDDMVAAITELNYFEDEACSFQDGPNNCGNHATDRILAKYDCNGSNCSITSDYTPFQEQFGPSGNGGTASHGTLVATIVGGDYTKGQADGVEAGDPAWTSGAHSAVWEDTSSGVADDANLILIGGGTCNSCGMASFQVAVTEKADTINASWGNNSAGCNISSSWGFEDALENAYDDGVFVTVSAGNNSGPSSTICNMSGPADTPKAFAVNGLNTEQTACEGDYEVCQTDAVQSSRGGVSITVNGSTKTASGIDLTAPARVRRRTSWRAGSPNGHVYETHVGGTSIAAPIVSGAGLVVKDFMLSDGFGFYNYPGRLQATMLAMGDGWSTTSGMDVYGGAGRLKTRLFDSSASSSNRVTGPFFWRSKTYTFTSTGATSFFLNSAPMSGGTDFAKCVMWEGEDMSSKTDVSDVDMTMFLRDPYYGSCSSAGNLLAVWSDNSSDMRHKIRVESGALSGRCLEVFVNRKHVTSAGATVNLFCYSAGEADYED